jgi:hypothetical protein
VHQGCTRLARHAVHSHPAGADLLAFAGACTTENYLAQRRFLPYKQEVTGSSPVPPTKEGLQMERSAPRIPLPGPQSDDAIGDTQPRLALGRGRSARTARSDPRHRLKANRPIITVENHPCPNVQPERQAFRVLDFQLAPPATHPEQPSDDRPRDRPVRLSQTHRANGDPEHVALPTPVQVRGSTIALDDGPVRVRGQRGDTKLLQRRDLRSPPKLRLPDGAGTGANRRGRGQLRRCQPGHRLTERTRHGHRCGTRGHTVTRLAVRL